MTRPVFVAADSCCGHDNGVPCGKDPSYFVRVRDCRPCKARGLPRCVTHNACVDHAADVRAGRLGSHIDGSRVVAAQVVSSSPFGRPSFPARFASSCSVCAVPILAGDPVRWDTSGSGRVQHVEHPGELMPGGLR